ncbi:homeodomain-like protein [Rhizophagus clarus]|uniref:Homeodomain-like protein n=1 Tax=Rhizophagus clarus TaxID=94130 RepID=A0A8H3LEI8_9GLOM|nr:homeodomain-like protein [Rhizophagus clarus]
MLKEFSVDLRWRVVYLYYDDLSTVDIANTLHMSKSIVDWYLDELVYEMECITGKRVSVAVLWRSLQYLGITRKKLHKAALERNEIIRAHYLATIGEHYTRNQLIFLDESAKDKRSLTRLYGYSPRNIRAQKKVPIMNPYPGDNSVIVMDNAKIHHDNELVVLLEELGCRVVFLPPYSP